MPTLIQLNVKKWLRNQRKRRIKSRLKRVMQGRKIAAIKEKRL
jgi:hypothetical protein